MPISLRQTLSIIFRPRPEISAAAEDELYLKKIM